MGLLSRIFRKEDDFQKSRREAEKLKVQQELYEAERRGYIAARKREAYKRGFERGKRESKPLVERLTIGAARLEKAFGFDSFGFEAASQKRRKRRRR